MSTEPNNTPADLPVDDVAAAERAARIDTSSPLPRHASTLAYIPPERRDNYVRTQAGGFRLEWVSEDDDLNRNAFLEDIAAGRVKMLPPGETPASQAAADALREQMAAGVATHIAELEAAERQRLRAIADARFEAARAKADAERARLRKQFGVA